MVTHSSVLAWRIPGTGEAGGLSSMGSHRVGYDWSDLAAAAAVKSTVVVMYGYESWTIKKTEHQRIDAFERWCWRRLLRVPWTARRTNQSILKEISPEYSLEGLMLKLKLQYFGLRMRRTDSFKRLWCWKDWRQEEKGTTEDKMVGWHHELHGHEFEQALGVGDGQWSLGCYIPWGCKKLDMTEWLNWTEPQF